MDLESRYNQLLYEHRLISNEIKQIKTYSDYLDQEDKDEINKLKEKQTLIMKEIQDIFNNNLNNVTTKSYIEKTPKKRKKESKLKDYIKIFEDLCVELTDKLEKKFPTVNKNSHKKTLIVETRNLNHLEFVIKNTIQKLGEGWGHIIFCHSNNYDLVKKICDDISTEIEINVLEKDLSRNYYNNLFLDINFWEKINCEKVLVYQTDTFIFKSLDEDFFKYDWVGWAWNDDHTKYIENSFLKWKDLWGCNGGLNLRTVPVIKEILKKIPIPKGSFEDMDKIPEDTYFSWYIKTNYRFPTKELCYNFANDKVFSENTFGTHQPWIGDMENFIKFVKNLYDINE